MARRLISSLPATLIESWRVRLENLTCRLRQASRDEHAWFWEMQSRVMQFLLRRYTNEPEPQISITTLFDATSPAPLLSANPPPPAFVSSRSLTQLSSAPNPPRGARKVRPVIQQIAASNQPRYEQLRSGHREEIIVRRQQNQDLRVLVDRYVDALARTQWIHPPTVYADVPIDDSVEQMFCDLISGDDRPRPAVKRRPPSALGWRGPH